MKKINSDPNFMKGFAAGVIVGVIFFFGVSKIGKHAPATADKTATSVAANDKEDDSTATADGKCPKARKPSNIVSDLLPPPNFSPDLPDEIEASKDGGAFIQWVGVPKALRYEVVVTDVRGARVNRIRSADTELTLKDFRTGDEVESKFYVSLATVNVDGKVGSFGKPKKIVVKDRPDITAPTIKSIKTED